MTHVIVSLRPDPPVGSPLHPAVDKTQGAIGGTVIQEKNLEIDSRPVQLGGPCPEHLVQRILRIVNGNNDQ